MLSVVVECHPLIQATQLTLFQWFSQYYPMGKTSTTSAFNVPGKIGWATMEAPGFITLLYLMYSLPKQEGIESLPFVNWTMAALFVSPSLWPGNFVTAPFETMLLTILRFQDNSLHLPRPYFAIVPEPVNVTHPHFSLGFGAQFPIDKRHLYWGLAWRIRPHHKRRMDRHSDESGSRLDDLWDRSLG